MLGKLPVPGRPTIWTTVEQVPTALTEGTRGGGGCLDIFTVANLSGCARYQLRNSILFYLLFRKPLSQKQTTIFAFIFSEF